MSDTPITDAAKRTIEGFADEWVPRYIAEELERKLNKAEATILQMHKDLGHELRDPNGTIWDECARLQKDLAEVTKQRDALVAAIEQHRTTLPYPPEYEDYQLYEILKGGTP